MTTAPTAIPNGSSLADLREDDALAAYQVQYATFRAIRRPRHDPLVLAERVFPATMVATAVGLSWLLELSPRDFLAGLALAIALLFAFISSFAGSAQFREQGGPAPRHVHLLGPWLVIQVGPAYRCYDLRTTRIHHYGEWAGLRAASRRWIADPIPRDLLELALELQSHEAREYLSEMPADEVVALGSWRGIMTRFLLTSSVVSSYLLVLLIALLAALAVVPFYDRFAMLVFVIAGFWSFMYVYSAATFLLSPVSYFAHGMRIGANELGVYVRDLEHVELVRWSANPVKRVSSDAVLLRTPMIACVTRSHANGASFDHLVACIQRHSVPRRGGARVSAGLHTAVAVQVVMAALFVALGIVAIGFFAGVVQPDLRELAVITVVCFVVPNAYAVARARLVVRPPAHEQPLPRRARRRIPGAAGAAAMLVAPGALVVAIIASAYRDQQRLGLALVIALIGLVLLVAARSLDGVRILERALVVAAAAAVAGGVLLIDAWQYTLAAGVDSRIAMLLAGAVALLLVASIVGRGAAPPVDRHPHRSAALALLPVAATVSIAFAGVVALDIRSDALIDPAAPDEAVHASLVRDIRIDETPITTAWDEAYVLAVEWDGDEATVEPAAGSTRPGRDFDDAAGQRALQRLERLLSFTAAQPGRRPVLRRIVLARSNAALRVHVALAKLEATPTSPSYLVRTLDDGHRGSWSNSKDVESSHYRASSASIVMMPSMTEGVLSMLRSPLDTKLDDDEHIAFGVLQHEIEHAMSTHGSDPRWLTEAAAEVVPSWAGAPAAAAAAIDLRLPHERFGTAERYQEWASDLQYLLWRCDLNTREPGTRDEAMQLLRPRGDDSLADAVAGCLVDAEATSLSASELADVLREAGDEDGDEALWDALVYDE